MGVIAAIATGKAILNLIQGLSKKARGAAETMAGLVDEAPNELAHNFFQQFDGVPPAVQEEFLGFFGEMGAHYPKLTKNPDLVKVWLAFKDGNVDLLNIFKKFPDDNPDFYEKFSDVFIDGNGNVNLKAKDFLGDIDGNQKLLDKFKNHPKLMEAWDGLKNSPLRLDPYALELGDKMLDDGFTLTHLKNIAKDCANDIRGLEIADKFGGKTSIENAQIMTRKAFKSKVDGSIEIISNNLGGIYIGNGIDGWTKLKECVDKISNGTINPHTLIRGADEIGLGKKLQIENGKADMEIFDPVQESYQMKRVTGGLKSKIEDADIQLSGINGEIPSTGHTKIVEAKLANTTDPMYNMNEQQVLSQLQNMNLNINHAEKVVLQNNISRFIFDASQL